MANSKHIGHFYAPITFYGGKVLKYMGIASEENKEWFVNANPGTIILPERVADRINANDYSPFGDSI